LTEHFYQHYTLSHLAPVLDTLRWLSQESSVWFELTTLLIPEANDSVDDIRRMCEWIHTELGDDVPLHFTAFHPDFRMMDTPPTPPDTLARARDIALESGLNYVYVGNVLDAKRASTYCPQCGQRLIRRQWYDIDAYSLEMNQCKFCGYSIAGRFADKPGHWGTRRVAVDPSSLLRKMAEEQ
jgi:pyruvate formate lyase activating enzyme